MGIGRGRVGLGAAGVLAALTTASMAWATLLTPTVVAGGVGNQVSATAAPGAAYIAYSANRPGQLGVFDAYVRPLGVLRTRINPVGTTAFTGGIDGPPSSTSRSRAAPASPTSSCTTSARMSTARPWA
jgi:hypothetical protein